MSYSEEDRDNADGGDEYGAGNGYLDYECGGYDGCNQENGGSQWSLDSATAAELFMVVSADQNDDWRSEGSAERRREDYYEPTDEPTHEISCVSADSSEPNERGTSLAREFGIMAVEDGDRVMARRRSIEWAKQYSIELECNTVPDESKSSIVTSMMVQTKGSQCPGTQQRKVKQSFEGCMDAPPHR